MCALHTGNKQVVISECLIIKLFFGQLIYTHTISSSSFCKPQQAFQHFNVVIPGCLLPVQIFGWQRTKVLPQHCDQTNFVQVSKNIFSYIKHVDSFYSEVLNAVICSMAGLNCWVLKQLISSPIDFDCWIYVLCLMLLDL